MDTDTIEEMTFDELDEYANESMLESNGNARYVSAVEVDEWTALIEPSGWRVAAEPGVRERVSRGTEVVSVGRLTHLVHLDLRWTKLDRLPGWITTLRRQGCAVLL